MGSILVFAPIVASLVIIIGSTGYGLGKTPKTPGRWGPFFCEALPLPVIILPPGVALLMGNDLYIPLIPPFWAGVIGALLGLGGGSLGVAQVIIDARRGVRSKGWKSELNAFPLALPLFVLSVVVFSGALKFGAKFGASLASYPNLPSPAQENLPIIASTLIGGEIAIVAVAASWAFCVYVLALPRSRDGSRLESSKGSALERILDGAGQVSTSIGTAIDQLVAFVKAGLWGILAAYLIEVAWPPGGLIGWFLVALGVVAAGKGLSEIGPVLRRRGRLENQGVYGQSRNATPDEARQATRGTGGQVSVDDRHF